MKKAYHLTCKVVSLLCSMAGVLLGRREVKEADRQHSHWLAVIPLTNCAQFISSGCCPSCFINLFKVSIKSPLVPCHFCHCWAEIIAKYDNYLPEPARVWEGRGFQEFNSELFQVSNSHVHETAEPHRKISHEKSETRQSHDLPWRAPLLKPFKQFEECLPCFQTMHPKTKPSVTLCKKSVIPETSAGPCPSDAAPSLATLSSCPRGLRKYQILPRAPQGNSLFMLFSLKTAHDWFLFTSNMPRFDSGTAAAW